MSCFLTWFDILVISLNVIFDLGVPSPIPDFAILTILPAFYMVGYSRYRMLVDAPVFRVSSTFSLKRLFVVFMSTIVVTISMYCFSN
jgi:hypothetical protein